MDSRDVLELNVAYINAARKVTDIESAARLLRGAGLDALADAALAVVPVLKADAREKEIAWRKADIDGWK